MALISTARIESLQIMANRLRRHSLLSTTEAKSGHPSTCFSCAELVSTIFFEFLRYDLDNPDNPANDRFVLSKGHAAPILWGALAETGAFSVDRLPTLRKIDSDLEGHPTPRSPYVDVATGSLGQGLSNAVGMALSARVDGVDNKIYVLMGDGESAEGAVWEAAALASHYNLSSLVGIVDVNRLGQSEATMYGHDLEVYANRFKAFGWNTQIIDGHDIGQIVSAIQTAVSDNSVPSVLIAKTFKGKGVSFMEDADGWHGKPVTDEAQVRQALAELGEDRELPEKLVLDKPSGSRIERKEPNYDVAPPEYSLGDAVATRVAYGTGLAKLGQVNPLVVGVDGDCKNSTFSDTFRKQFPDRFFECYIAEQNMVGAAAGLASLGKIPFASSFACFLTRAYDFIRIAGISRVNMKICGSHAGVSIGEDGPSQMGLEDLAMMRAIGGSTVLYPSDGVSAEKLVVEAAKTPGIVYIRTSRPKTSVIYSNDEEFPVGGCKVVKSSDQDQVTLVGAGVTLHEALRAHELLKANGISAKVVDLYSVKPVDQKTLKQVAEETGKIVTIEDHNPEGGIGEAVASTLAGVDCQVSSLAVRGLPRSGGSSELLEEFGISARRIAEFVEKLL